MNALIGGAAGRCASTAEERPRLKPNENILEKIEFGIASRSTEYDEACLILIDAGETLRIRQRIPEFLDTCHSQPSQCVIKRRGIIFERDIAEAGQFRAKSILGVQCPEPGRLQRRLTGWVEQ